MAAHFPRQSINQFQGGWEDRLRDRDIASPNRGPDSYRYTPERPKLLRSPPPVAGGAPAPGLADPSLEGLSQLDELRIQVFALHEKADTLTGEGEDLRKAVYEMRETHQQLTMETRAQEEAIGAASMRQQEAEEDLDLLQPKRDRLEREYNVVQTTLADLRIEMQAVAEQASKAEDAEEAVENLLKSVLHRSSLELVEYEKELDQEAAKIAPHLAAANRERVKARQELQELRATVSSWSSGAGSEAATKSVEELQEGLGEKHSAFVDTIGDNLQKAASLSPRNGRQGTYDADAAAARYTHKMGR